MLAHVLFDKLTQHQKIPPDGAELSHHPHRVQRGISEPQSAASLAYVSAVQTHLALLALASASHRNVQALHRFHRISHDAIDLASLQTPDDHCSNHDAQNAHLLAWDEIAANLSAHRMLWDVLWSTLDAQNARHHVQDDLHGSQADQRPDVQNDHDRGTLHHHDETTMIR